MTAKPTLGFPTRTQAVQELRRQGVPTRMIAAKLNIEVKTVSALEHRRVRPAVEVGHSVALSAAVINALKPHAAKRNIDVNDLVRGILEQIAADGIVDAVLDDA